MSEKVTVEFTTDYHIDGEYCGEECQGLVGGHVGDNNCYYYQEPLLKEGGKYKRCADCIEVINEQLSRSKDK